MTAQRRRGRSNSNLEGVVEKQKVREFGVRWEEVDRKGRLVVKERIFDNPADQGSFSARIGEKGSFVRFVAWLG